MIFIELLKSWAAMNGHFKIVKFLIENGANIYVNNSEAFRLAFENGHLEIIKLFKSIKRKNKLKRILNHLYETN